MYAYLCLCVRNVPRGGTMLGHVAKLLILLMMNVAGSRAQTWTCGVGHLLQFFNGKCLTRVRIIEK
jgi:hypothetical protein